MLNKTTQGPEDWMCSIAPAPEAVAARETIRQWYDRTTRNVRKAIIWATLVAFVFAGAMYGLASFSFLARLQTFNGAFTIPIAALIWMVTFVYIFLVPSREASFRGQEWIEAMVRLVEETVRTQVAPAAMVWRRVGERVEVEMPLMLTDLRSGLDVVRSSAAKLEAAVAKNEKLSEDAAPAIEALKRIEARLEMEIQTGIFDEVRAAARAVKNFTGPAPAAADLPNMSKALAFLEAKKK